MKPSIILGLGLLLAAALNAAPGRYESDVDEIRAKRLDTLSKPDGWLTLIGLHFLKPGASPVGRAPDNAVVLASGPDRFGTATLSDRGEVTFTPAPGTEVEIDGRPAKGTVTLKSRGKPTVVSSGTVSFFVIERGGGRALRVRDSEAEHRTHFLGLDYFPTDASWRIEAQWVPFETPRQIPIVNTIGNTYLANVPGKAVFQRDGKTYELLAVADSDEGRLFFNFADATSGDRSYALRFLYSDPPKDGRVVLDFNLAVNPPCAFTAFATCPLPPKENHLALAVTAGEKNYRGADH